MFNRRELLKAALAVGVSSAIPRFAQKWADKDPEGVVVSDDPIGTAVIEALFPPNEYGHWERVWLDLKSVSDEGRVVTVKSVLTDLCYRVTCPVRD